jgi:hypothetical protein
MTGLDIIQIIGICLLMGCALVYRYKYKNEVSLRIKQHFDDDMNFQLVNARFLRTIKELKSKHEAALSDLENTRKKFREYKEKQLAAEWSKSKKNIKPRNK